MRSRKQLAEALARDEEVAAYVGVGCISSTSFSKLLLVNYDIASGQNKPTSNTKEENLLNCLHCCNVFCYLVGATCRIVTVSVCNARKNLEPEC